MKKNAPEEFARLTQIIAQLRAPDGCPWDREQTHATLRASLIEETAETLDAIERGDDADLREELGDLLMQPIFHAQIADEENRFDLADVLHEICEKLVRRHPHVFGDTKVENTAGVLVNWDAIKKQEKAAKTALRNAQNANRVLETANAESANAEIELPASANSAENLNANSGISTSTHSIVNSNFKANTNELPNANSDISTNVDFETNSNLAANTNEFAARNGEENAENFNANPEFSASEIANFVEISSADSDVKMRDETNEHVNAHVDSQVFSVANSTENAPNRSLSEANSAWFSLEDSVLSNVPLELPALSMAMKVSKKAAKVGFEWSDFDGVLDKLREEIGELQVEIDQKNRERASEELGDLLFTIVNVARWQKVDAELALRDTVRRFTRRFQAMERESSTRNENLEELSPAQWDELWNRAKLSTRNEE